MFHSAEYIQPAPADKHCYGLHPEYVENDRIISMGAKCAPLKIKQTQVYVNKDVGYCSFIMIPLRLKASRHRYMTFIYQAPFVF